MPGLVVSSDSPTQPRYQIRGIQTGDFGVGTDPAVGVYVDGIYAARSGASLLAFNDIERIEVLKGPQGTLFGRNSAAGAISIVTRQPENEFDSLVRLRFGEYGKQYYEGMLNTPITDSVALRINGVYNKSDGWMKDAATGEDLHARGELGRARGATLGAVGQTRPRRSPGTMTTWTSWRGPRSAWCRCSPARRKSRTQPTRLPTSIPARPRSTTMWSATRNRASSTRLTLFLDHSFGWADFRSSTSWRQFETVNREDEDGTNLIAMYFDTANIEDNESFYQEFKFSGATDRIDWVGGVSYYHEKADQVSDTHTYTDGIDTLGANLGIWDWCGPAVPAVRRHQRRSRRQLGSPSACWACRGARRCTTTAISRRTRRSAT